MKMVTQRLRNAFQAIEPLCGLMSAPSAGPLTVCCGASSCHVDESCHASNVAGHFSFGKGFPKKSQCLPLESSQNAGWPSGTSGGFGLLSDFSQSTRNGSKFAAPSFQTQRPQR